MALIPPHRPALTRRRILSTAGALAAAGVVGPASAAGRSRLILLGTGGGPTPKANRSAPASAIVVGGDVYVIDCGDGVARQMVRAGPRRRSGSRCHRRSARETAGSSAPAAAGRRYRPEW